MTEEQSYFYGTSFDWELFGRCTRGLAAREPDEPYGNGPHNVRAFLWALETKRHLEVFEVGFNLGYSAAIMSGLGATVHSIDKRDTLRMQESSRILRERFPGLSVQLGVTVETCDKPPFKPTLAYIDGAHDFENVRRDVRYCRDTLGVTCFLMDDWPALYGDVAKAVLAEELLPLNIIGSMAYCVVPEAHGYRCLNL